VPPSSGVAGRLQQPPPLLIPFWSLRRRTHGLALILAAFENQLFSVHSRLRLSRVENQVLSGADSAGFLKQAEYTLVEPAWRTQVNPAAIGRLLSCLVLMCNPTVPLSGRPLAGCSAQWLLSGRRKGASLC
jgi:hypothetical protein